MYKGARIYLAGHTGLLGSAILKELRSNGCSEVITMGRSELDITNQSAVNSFFDFCRPEYVFLAAGLTGGIQANKNFGADYLHVNLSIQDNCFEAAQRNGVKHLVFYGSSCMYPKNADQPIREASLMTGPIEQTSDAYAIAKLAGVVACRRYNEQYRTNRFIALVPNSIYGPNDNFDPDNSHVFSALISRIHRAKIEGMGEITLWGSGMPRREFLFSKDAAKASLFAVENADRLENRIYNIGAGVDCSIKELAGKIAGVVGYTGRILWDTSKPDGTMRKLLDSGDFRKLGWKAKVGLDEGIEKTYEWFLTNEMDRSA